MLSWAPRPDPTCGAGDRLALLQLRVLAGKLRAMPIASIVWLEAVSLEYVRDGLLDDLPLFVASELSSEVEAKLALALPHTSGNFVSHLSVVYGHLFPLDGKGSTDAIIT